jgi:undecaprenyl-diphosphatase
MSDAAEQFHQPLLRPLIRRWSAVFAALSAGATVLMGMTLRGETTPSRLDIWVSARLANTPRVPSPAMAAFVEAVPLLAIGGSLILAIFFLLRRRREFTLLALAAPALTILAAQFGKHAVGRTIHGHLAFPSGHTAAATSVLMVLGLAVLDRVARRVFLTGIAVLVAVTAVATGVGVALSSLDIHYPTDTIAGYLTGLAVTLGCACAIDILSPHMWPFLDRTVVRWTQVHLRRTPTRSRRGVRPTSPGRVAIAVSVATVLLVVMGGAVMARQRALQVPAGEAAAANSAMERTLASASASAAASESAAENAHTVHLVFPTGRPLKLLILGDSVMQGYYASEQSLSAANLIASGLARWGKVDETNASVAGRTVTDALHVPLGRTQYDLIVIMFGNNDVFKSNIDTFNRDYPRLMAKLHASSPAARVMCLPPWMRPNTYVSRNGNLAEDFFMAAQRQCEASDGVFVDSLVGQAGGDDNAPIGTINFLGPPASDDGHPNDRGHKAIADATLRMITVEPAPSDTPSPTPAPR